MRKWAGCLLAVGLLFSPLPAEACKKASNFKVIMHAKLAVSARIPARHSFLSTRVSLRSDCRYIARGSVTGRRLLSAIIRWEVVFNPQGFVESVRFH